MNRASRLWPLITITLAFLTLCGLGSWQLQRLTWKDGVIAALEANRAKPPLVLDQLQTTIPQGSDYTPATATGRFAHEGEITLLARTRNGVVGRSVVTPFHLNNNSWILVDRGFVPESQLDAIDRPAAEVTLTGYVLTPPAKGWMQPPNTPAKRQWYWLDSDAIASQYGYVFPFPYVLKVTETAAAPALPQGYAAEVNIANNHRQYAVTWFALAAILVVLSTFLLRK